MRGAPGDRPENLLRLRVSHIDRGAAGASSHLGQRLFGLRLPDWSEPALGAADHWEGRVSRLPRTDVDRSVAHPGHHHRQWRLPAVREPRAGGAAQRAREYPGERLLQVHVTRDHRPLENEGRLSRRGRLLAVHRSRPDPTPAEPRLYRLDGLWWLLGVGLDRSEAHARRRADERGLQGLLRAGEHQLPAKPYHTRQGCLQRLRQSRRRLAARH